MMPESEVDYRPRSFAFACDIVKLYQTLMKTAPHHIARQVLKSGTSIGANLEEAKPAQSRKDLISKFSIALKEARETQYWLRLIIATELADPSVIAGPLQEATEFVAILTVSVRRLKGQTQGN